MIVGAALAKVYLLEDATRNGVNQRHEAQLTTVQTFDFLNTQT